MVLFFLQINSFGNNVSFGTALLVPSASSCTGRSTRLEPPSPGLPNPHFLHFPRIYVFISSAFCKSISWKQFIFATTSKWNQLPSLLITSVWLTCLSFFLLFVICFPSSFLSLLSHSSLIFSSILLPVLLLLIYSPLLPPQQINPKGIRAWSIPRFATLPNLIERSDKQHRWLTYLVKRGSRPQSSVKKMEVRLKRETILL